MIAFHQIKLIKLCSLKLTRVNIFVYHWSNALHFQLQIYSSYLISRLRQFVWTLQTDSKGRQWTWKLHILYIYIGYMTADISWFTCLYLPHLMYKCRWEYYTSIHINTYLNQCHRMLLSNVDATRRFGKVRNTSFMSHRNGLVKHWHWQLLPKTIHVNSCTLQRR